MMKGYFVKLFLLGFLSAIMMGCESDAITDLDGKMVNLVYGTYEKSDNSRIGSIEMIVAEDKTLCKVDYGNGSTSTGLRTQSTNSFDLYLGIKDATYKMPDFLTEGINRESKEADESLKERILQVCDYTVDKPKAKMISGYECDMIHDDFYKKFGKSFRKYYITHELPFLEKIKSMSDQFIPGLPLEIEIFEEASTIHLVHRLETLSQSPMNEDVFNIKYHAIEEEKLMPKMEQALSTRKYESPYFNSIFAF